MGFFTQRERAELGESLDVKGQGRVREPVREPLRRDYTPRRPPRSPDAPRTPDTARSPDTVRSPDPPRSPDLAGHVGTLMQRVSETSLREIDELIAMLKRRREKVLTETVRMQRDIVEYAKLNQSTIQSVKVISDSLAHLKGAPQTAEFPAVAEVADEERGEAVPEVEAQSSADDATSGEQAQDVAVAETETAVDESLPSEQPAPSERPE